MYLIKIIPNDFTSDSDTKNLIILKQKKSGMIFLLLKKGTITVNARLVGVYDDGKKLDDWS